MKLTAAQRKTMLAPRRVDDETADLRRRAKDAARALGHDMGPFAASENDQHYCRCTVCFMGLSVQPKLKDKDGRGYDGRAVREKCDHAGT